jgi:hypothetical protein
MNKLIGTAIMDRKTENTAAVHTPNPYIKP